LSNSPWAAPGERQHLLPNTPSVTYSFRPWCVSTTRPVPALVFGENSTIDSQLLRLCGPGDASSTGPILAGLSWEQLHFRVARDFTSMTTCKANFSSHM